jgi:hypothetical protein
MDLKKFLEDNKEEIVDFISSNQRPYPFANIFSKMLNELANQMHISINGRPPYVFDKLHVELTIALLETLWCGCLLQAKANKNSYPKDWPDMVKKALNDAFEIGRTYAVERP